jgi:hypothetical protein
LLGDTKTNEIAMFELGTHKTKLWRSSKDEWLAGTEGFYWGCNNTKDLDVRMETVPGLDGKPANVVFRPSDRDRKWIELYRAHKGKIDADFGFLAFTTPPLAAFPSCDAKFTTSDMAKELKTFALFGNPLGRVWTPSEGETRTHPEIRPLVPNDWTVLRADAPPTSSGNAPSAADIASKVKEDDGKAHRDIDPQTAPPVWHGTILPAGDADTWLAAAFADYEKDVALEKALQERGKDGKLDKDDRDRLELALFGLRSRYFSAVKRLGKDVPLSKTEADWTRDEWYEIATGKGVLLLDDLRAKLGDARFEAMMDAFGRAHAGKPASTSAFRKAAEHSYGKSLDSFFTAWLDEDGLPDGKAGAWSIHAFEDELPKALIVYGTRKEADAQREAAGVLQAEIRRMWSNITVPIKADSDVTDDDLRGHHLLLIGRPDSNAVAARCAGGLPLSFGPGSFVQRGETFANPATAVVAAGANPNDPRYSVVVYAGLGADATWRSVQQFPYQFLNRARQAAQVLLLPAGGSPKGLVVTDDQKPAPGLKAAG